MDSSTLAPSPWSPHPQPFSYCLHLLCLTCLALVLLWTIHFRGGLTFSSPNKNLIFNIHPVSMLGGLILLSSEAIIVFKTLPGLKRQRKIAHLTLQLLALLSGSVGIYAAFKFHSESNIGHLYSLHSWLGLSTICLFAIQWLIGFLSFFYPRLSPHSRTAALPWHVFHGLFIYGLALATAEVGIMNKLNLLEGYNAIGMYSLEAILVNSLGIVLVLLGWFVSVTAMIDKTPSP